MHNLQAPQRRYDRTAEAPSRPAGDPFAALAARKGRPLRVGILSDFTRAAYANGAVFQTRFLLRELRRRGHQVLLVGPHDPDADPPSDPSLRTMPLPSHPLRSYPGLRVPLPFGRWIFDR